jgi:hypothetical protein
MADVVRDHAPVLRGILQEIGQKLTRWVNMYYKWRFSLHVLATCKETLDFFASWSLPSRHFTAQ